MMPQQSTVCQNTMMNNQQTNVYDLAGGNPSLNRTSSQRPMAITNHQWQNRPPQNGCNQVKSTSNCSRIFCSLSNSDDTC